MAGASASLPGRRRLLWRLAVGGVAALTFAACLAGGEAQERRYTVAFANLTEEPGVTIEGTGFTGREVRESFALAARQYPVDLVYYDNQRDNARAIANAEDAIAKRVGLYVIFHRDPATNAAIAEKLRAAGIPVLAINYPAGPAPLYSVDNLAAGRIAGEALADFASRNWRNQKHLVVVIGALNGDRMAERIQGVTQGLRPQLPAVRIVPLDTHGNPAQVTPLLDKLLAANPATKALIATMDDTTALVAKATLEASGRLRDAAIVSHGVDRSIHGGINDRKEIDPTNRGSIVIGSVAFYLDRYGYDVLPLAMRILRGESVPHRTTTRHRLVTAANVFIEYPPYDMN